ncbi:MAG: DUF1987 domain-containing protein [Candidatus Magnetoovum sp. WYHC-5]|nr:DUF1987 domain-containing protein [Candidatus Magnetoovum sp. WYHC-5]
MKSLKINRTQRTPEIDFNLELNTFVIKGESYPEDARKFYKPIIEFLEVHLNTVQNADIIFDFELTYFNSSTSKIISRLFNLLENSKDNNVIINWHYLEDDDYMKELGEELADDLAYAVFNNVPKIFPC